MRVIVGDGKVSRVIRRPGDAILSHREIELQDRDNVLRAISTLSPDVAINTAAKINLEWCEDNQQEAFDTNVTGVSHLLEACHDCGAKLVQISSGCIFDGNDQISTEESKPSPACFYAETKLAADIRVLEHSSAQHLIVRPRQLISAVRNPTNMLTKFAEMEEIFAIDEPNSLTCIEDLGCMIEHLLDQNQSGIFNCANLGALSPLWVAQSIAKTISPKLRVHPVSYLEYSKTVKVKRVNTLLSVDKLIGTGFIPRTAQEALFWCLENYQ